MWAVGSPSVMTMICLFCAAWRPRMAPRQPEAGVDVGEVLRDALGRVVEVEPQVDPAVVDAHRLRRRVEQLPLGQDAGEACRTRPSAGCPARYCARTIACSASATFLVIAYLPYRPIEPLMSISTTVAQRVWYSVSWTT